ncbi:hypothetical protein [Colwellia psychrerythraea]|uniref:Endonuclease/exonuclease/phosphatase n=1 Tax=Colwellia psychrerythraea TaxID=28229 RepID=A0A099L349_COLPS|nr:hypothetical protein [Colwellia psychrerythraea]KGJ96293.1 hypothetical protein GAB14E_0240 [Colwellia psychrerythraea]
MILLFILSSFSVESFAEIADKAPDASTVISLNIYGWKAMPAHSDDYAELIKGNKVDILGIQEGVDDW